jgi:hypothetical protein
MAAPINGRINGWPVWIMIDLVTFGYTTGLLDCCPYGQSDVVPNEIWEACNRIFNAEGTWIYPGPKHAGHDGSHIRQH